MRRDLRERAVELRKRGLSYSEIRDKVPVSKSTLSLWLNSVELTEEQKNRLAEVSRQAGLAGANKRREMRRALQQRIYESSQKAVGPITSRELWLMGTVLYWAEGAKEKEYRPGSGLEFTNSDPALARLFLKWIQELCGVDRERIVFAIFLHESHRDSLRDVQRYWADQTGFPLQTFERVYFKSNKPTTRRNTGRSYHGVLRIEVRGSSEELRRITGWMLGIDISLGGSVTATRLPLEQEIQVRVLAPQPPRPSLSFAPRPCPACPSA